MGLSCGDSFFVQRADKRDFQEPARMVSELPQLILVVAVRVEGELERAIGHRPRDGRYGKEGVEGGDRDATTTYHGRSQISRQHPNGGRSFGPMTDLPTFTNRGRPGRNSTDNRRHPPLETETTFSR